MPDCKTCIFTAFDFESGKTEYKPDAECEQNLYDVSVDDVPKSKQQSGKHDPQPFALFKKADKSVLIENSAQILQRAQLSAYKT